MLLAITGFVMIGLLMFFLLKGKAIPMTLFVVLPILGAVINGYGLTDIAGFIKDGVSTTWSMAALFVFVVTYFGIMTDVGMFDKLVQKLIRIADGHVLGIFLVVVLIATLGHLDGNSPTTYLIAIPALLPLCKKLNIRISAIMAVCCSVITVMNLVPWGGVLNRQSVTLAMDSGLLWRAYLPMQIFGWFCCVGLAVVMSRIEVRRGAGKVAVLAAGESAEAAADPEVLALQRPKLLWYNVILTVAVFVLLFKTSLPNYSIFMMGCVLALAVNYPNPKDQEARLAAHAPKVISLVATVLSAGVMVGVLNNTGMIVAMAELIIHILPDFLCAHLHLVFAFFGGFIPRSAVLRHSARAHRGVRPIRHTGPERGHRLWNRRGQLFHPGAGHRLHLPGAGRLRSVLKGAHALQLLPPLDCGTADDRLRLRHGLHRDLTHCPAAAAVHRSGSGRERSGP